MTDFDIEMEEIGLEADRFANIREWSERRRWAIGSLMRVRGYKNERDKWKRRCKSAAALAFPCGCVVGAIVGATL